MSVITGSIQIGEAEATVGATGKRQRGSMLWHWALMVALVGVVGLIGVVLSIPAGLDSGTGFGIGMIGGLFIYARWAKLLTVWRCRKTVTGQGVPLDLPVRWELTEDDIAYQIGGLVSRAPWRAVSEIFHDKGWWIVMVQGTPWFAADRFFADEAAQRAFVAEVLSHLTEDALARSAAAVKFVKG